MEAEVMLSRLYTYLTHSSRKSVVPGILILLGLCGMTFYGSGSIPFIGKIIYIRASIGNACGVFLDSYTGLKLWLELVTNVTPRLCVALSLALALVQWRPFRRMIKSHEAAIERFHRDRSWARGSFGLKSLRPSLILGFVFGVFAVIGTQAGDLVDQNGWKLAPHRFFAAPGPSNELPLWPLENMDLIARQENEFNACLGGNTREKCESVKPDYAVVGFRDTWAIVAGMVGGPFVGLLTGFIGGAYRSWVGGSLGDISLFATVLLGMAAGLIRQIKPAWVSHFSGVVWVAVSGSLLQRLVLLTHTALEKNLQDALELILMIGVPVLFINISGCVIFLWIMRFMEKDRLESEKNQMELQVLRAQTDPHFLNNVLTGIDWFFIRNDTPSAQRYIHKLADFYSALRKSISKQYIELAEEIEQVERYIDLQKLCLDELQARIIAEDGTKNCKVPSMCLMTLAENAFKHAFRSPPYQLTIKAYETGLASNLLTLEVSDNGKGIDSQRRPAISEEPVRSENLHGSGVALYQLKKGLDLAYQGRATLRISSVINHGTTVTIILPKEV